MDDRSVVAAQIGRPPRSAVDVAVRCPLGLPVVIEVPPLLDNGTPFPTLFWLSCPLAVKRIGRLESGGGVAAAEERLAADPELMSRHEAAMENYRRRRDRRLPEEYAGPRPPGGVGGARAGGKCLHAHYADYASGADNPVGEEAAAHIEPLDCAVPCVAVVTGAVVRNPAWVEPR